MNYKRVLNALWGDLNSYKAIVDGLVESYGKDKLNFDKEVDEIRESGDYSQGFIDRYIATGEPAIKYKGKFSSERAKVSGKIHGALDDLRMEIDGFFEGPVSQDLANKISAAKITGLRFSDYDIQIMQHQARSFMEASLIEQIARTRTKEETVYSKEDRAPEIKQKLDPYVNTVPVPTREYVTKEFAQFEYAVNLLLNSYCGTSCELVNALETVQDMSGLGSGVDIINADVAVRTGAVFEKMHNVMQGIEQSAPMYAKSVSPVTPSEKQRLDAAFDPSKLNTRTRQEVQAFASKTSFGDIMRKDPRYSKFFEPEPVYMA